MVQKKLNTLTAMLAVAVILLLTPVISASGKINVNTATAEELAEIRGVGPSLAERIIEFREQNGPFNSIDELMLVKGIGPKLLEKIQDQLTV